MSAKTKHRASAARPTDPRVAVAQRAALCVCVSALTYWCVSGALFLHALDAQRAVLVGIAAGLIGGLWVAVGSAAGVVALGMFTGPGSMWALPPSALPASLLWVLLGGAVAGAVAVLCARFPLTAKWLLWTAVALMVANLWVTVFEVATTSPVDGTTGQTYASLYQSLEGNLDVANQDDEHMFVWAITQMRHGTGYYEAFAAARPAISPGANGPTTVMNFREPLLYVVLAAARPAWLVLGALLALASFAAAGLVPLARGAVRLPVVLPGVAAVLSLSVVAIATVPLYAEVWAGLLCLVALELAAVSARSERWRAFVIASACVALLAFLIRELAVFALAGGLLSAWLSDAEQRAFRLRTWASVLAAAVVAYAVHAAVAAKHVVAYDATKLSHEGFGLFHGGLAFALHSLTYGGQAFSLSVAPQLLLPLLLAALGAAGIWQIHNRSTQAIAGASVASIVGLSLVASNGTTEVYANYWGLMSQFVVYACLPLAFAVLPVARVKAPSAAKGSR